MPIVAERAVRIVKNCILKDCLKVLVVGFESVVVML